MGNYGFRYTVEFKGEELEQLLIAPDKESAQKAFDYHTKVAEKNPDKIKIISTEVEEIEDKDIILTEPQPTSTAVN